ncbi:MAG: SIMPL domain-containing protein [Methanomicrobiales archaeon]|nr:SIMPL domain-containing protein [Methanomicrobiales archaeon]
MRVQFANIGPVLLAMALLAVICPGVIAQTTTDGDHVILTSATGEVDVSPDRAEVTFSVETENSDVTVAQDANARMMTSAIDAIVASGIPKEDIKTTGYSIYPIYDDTGGILSQKVKLYRVTNTILVTVRDVSKVGSVIDAAVSAGINGVSSINFLLSEGRTQVARTEAIQKAVAKCLADATTVAAATGVNITAVKEISVGTRYPPVYFDGYRSGGMEKSAVPTPIQPNDVKVTAQVSITYIIS